MNNVRDLNIKEYSKFKRTNITNKDIFLPVSEKKNDLIIDIKDNEESKNIIIFQTFLKLLKMTIILMKVTNSVEQFM